MAKSGGGRVGSSWNNSYGLQFYWSCTQSIEGNYSDFTVDVYGSMLQYATISVGARADSYIEVGGNKETKNFPAVSKMDSPAKDVYLGTKTQRIYHNSDGTLSNVWLYAYWPIRATISGTYRADVQGGINTGEIDSIPRQANITGADNFNDEGNPTLTYNNSAGNSVTDLVAGIYNTAGSVAYAGYRAVNKTGTLSYTFSLTINERNALRNAMPNSNSMTVRFYLRTTIGGNVFYSYVDRTVTLTNGNPTFSNFTYKDTNSSTVAITGNDQALIKGYSTLQVAISSAQKMVANKGSTAKNYTMDIDSRTGSANYSTGDIAVNLGTILNEGTKRLNVRAYDSRNNSTLVYKDITVHNYNVPVINATITRLNGFENETTLKVNGTYSRLTIGGTDKNILNDLEYRYREVGGSWTSWTPLPKTVGSGTFTCPNVVLNLDNNKQFDFEIRAIDNLVTYVRSDLKVSVGIPPFFVSDNKKAIGVNCIPPDNAQPGDIYTNGVKLLSFFYPVGSIYLSVNNVNPSTYFGGTWVAWGAGRVPVGVASSGTFNTVEKTGGSETQALATDQLPSHNHGFTGNATGSTTQGGTVASTTPGATGSTTPGATGSAGSHVHRMLGYGATLGTGTVGWRFGSGGGSWATGIIESDGAHTHGSAAHNHSSAAHSHTFTGAAHTHTTSGSIANTGSGNAHNNLQPYITCYMWKRTA